MSALTKRKKEHTPEEYLALEEQSEYRNEYENGEIVAMAGGSLDHAQITFNIAKTIDKKISEKCRTLPTEIKVQVENYRKFYYPDVLVICGEPKFYQKRNDTITNPLLVVEVLSDSTEAKDRGEKMLAYRTLESLQEYVLVSQDKPTVEQYIKNVEGNWIHKATIGIKSVVKFESIGIELLLEEIYQRVKL